jgi:PKHD-type hydroxylase
LTQTRLPNFRRALDSADWIDGRATVGAQGARVKRNQQLSDSSPLREQLGQRVLQLLGAKPVVPCRRPAPAFPAATLQPL